MEIKEAKDLLKLKWRNLTKEELEDLPCRIIGDIIQHKYCNKEHVEIFVKKIIENIAREFEMPFNDVEKVLTQENEIFYMMKNDMFWLHSSLRYIDAETDLLSYFKVPEMPSVNKVLREYKRLSSTQKKEFKAKI